MEFQSSRDRFLAGFLVLFMMAGAGWQLMKWWNRPTAVEFDNLKYIQLLTTALSSRSEKMVTQVEGAVKKRFDGHEMSEEEYAHFQKLIQMARDGQWKEADQQCFGFAEAQLNRSRSRPATQTHSHNHKHE
ncbi:hypothetical protein [Planctomicrobium sp. SH664]|uniref:hypothetical protein n=1 Tax=Planctomicrobium sp. SH664 TaxID=3448125 RepID=UPI003F5C95F1